MNYTDPNTAQVYWKIQNDLPIRQELAKLSDTDLAEMAAFIGELHHHYMMLKEQAGDKRFFPRQSYLTRTFETAVALIAERRFRASLQAIMSPQVLQDMDFVARGVAPIERD